MLKLSNFPIKTLKSTPHGSDNKSTWYLLQWWFIRQEVAWAYSFLPIWLKVLRNIENIVREEMNAAGWNEVLMPALWSKGHWLETWRWDTVDVLFKLPWPWSTEYALNSTHEELVTPLIWEFISSYKDLPIAVYQIQNKFRNETRAKSWLLRWREFLMKDLYSFHKDEEDFEKYYETMKKVYVKCFDRMWLWKDTYVCLASGWDFTEKYSHEFQTILEIWEDEIHICEKCTLAFNKEIVSEWFKCTECGNQDLKIEQACEVWNIFPLMTKFTKSFKTKFTDENWNMINPLMGCYWIWISRLMWVIAEYFCDDKGLIWPDSVAPYSHYILVMGDNIDKAMSLAKKIETEWGEVILDDRDVWFWKKAWDSELLWMPNRIIISDKSIEKWWYEFTKRWEEKSEIIWF